MDKRRVVITGIGAVTPLGNDAAATWAGIRAGKCRAGFGAGFAGGGLAGVIKRNVTNNAVKTATTPPDAKPSGLSGLVGGTKL